MREELTRCSPEKKAEGLFAGLARWSKEKGDPKNAAGAGTEGQEARKSSCRGKDAQVGAFRSLTRAAVACAGDVHASRRVLASVKLSSCLRIL